MRSVRVILMVAVIFAVAGSNLFAQTTLTLQNPSPTTSTLRAAANVGSTVYVAGYNGAFLKSTDGGTTWLRMTNAPLSVTNSFRGMAFRNLNTGYVIGYDSSSVGTISPLIYKTTNAGLNFSTNNTSGIAGGVRLHNTFFYADNNGWVVGENSSNGGEIYNSSNGSNWSELMTGINLSTDPFTFYAAYFTTNTTGWVVGTDRKNSPADSGLVYKTTNQGSSWARQANGISGHFDFRGVSFTNDSTGFVVGEDMDANTAAMFRTSDRGVTWTRVVQSSFGSTTILRDVKFNSANTKYGWAVGDSVGVNGNNWEIILYTSNGGNTWIRQDGNSTPGVLYSINIGSSISAWAVGLSNDRTALVENYLGAGVWYLESRSIGANSITGITMLNGSVGYAVSSPLTGVQPRFFTSVNGGFTWTGSAYVDGSSNPLFTAGQNEINSVQFFNQQNGWVAGTNNGYAVLYKTSNGGSSWFAPISINTAPASPSELFSVQFTGQVAGYAVGVQSGQPSVYYTVDAGADWTSPASGVPATSGQLNGTTAQPASGIAVGFTGTVGSPTTLILTTTNQGVNWSSQSVGSGNILTVTSTSSDSAWFGGTWTGGAFIYYTSNATTGTPSWFRANLPGNGASVTSIDFISNQIGYATGSTTTGDEWIIYSTDGGQNWNQLIDPLLGGSLNSISATLTNEVDFWTGGSNESILHGKIEMPIAYSYPATMFNTVYQNSGGANDIYRTTSDTARDYLALANRGTAPLTIDPSSIYWTNTIDGNVPQDYILPAGLTPSSGILTIQPGVIDSFLIVFEPKHFGPRNGVLNIPSNSALGNTMQFSMFGSQGPSSIQFDTTVRGSMSPLSMHNDTVPVGSFLNDTLFISNQSGTSRLNIESAVISGQNASDYRIVKGITAPIEVGQVAKLVVRFDPTAGFARFARLIITSDAQNDPSQLVLLNGYGSCTEDAMIGADTLFLNDTLTYQTSNDSLLESVTFCNTCSSPVTVTSQQISGDPFDYSILTPLPSTVAPGECDTMTILFAPVLGNSALRDAQLVVKTNARTTGTLTRQLDGIGCTQFVAVTPAGFSGDTVHVGDSVIYQALVTNSGACPINIDSLKFLGDNGYSVISATGAQSLAPGASDTIIIVFKPSKADTTVSGLLYVYTNATNSSLDSVSFTNSTLVSSVKELGIVANDYALSQNYPNPFNPSTMIRYDIPSRQMVTVDIVNSIGEVVAVPVNEVEDAGQYHFTFRSENLPNGVYMYRLHAGTTTITRTMSIVK